MKKALVAVGLLVLLLYVASWFWAGDEVTSAAAQSWPDGLGSLVAVATRYPPRSQNEAARKLTALAGPITPNEAITRYVRQEIARGDLGIGEPPAIPDLSAIRELLLHERVVWQLDIAAQHGGHLDKIPMYREVTRAFLASALARARQNDPAAWQDLHAAWNLTTSIEDDPHLIPRLVAVAMTRAINAVAWKMPLPAPPWLTEVQRRDLVRPMFETLQYQKWWTWKHELFPLRPFAGNVERERALMAELTRATDCEFRPDAGNRVTTDVADITNLDMTWRRVFRYRAEREATANALRIRAGQPIDPGSRCSDGSWSFDGKTLQFAKPISLPEKIDTSMPLTLQVAPAVK